MIFLFDRVGYVIVPRRVYLHYGKQLFLKLNHRRLPIELDQSTSCRSPRKSAPVSEEVEKLAPVERVCLRKGGGQAN